MRRPPFDVRDTCRKLDEILVQYGATATPRELAPMYWIIQAVRYDGEVICPICGAELSDEVAGHSTLGNPFAELTVAHSICSDCTPAAGRKVDAQA